MDALLAKVTDTSLPLSQVTALLIGQGIPLLMDRHAADTYAALSILTGYTVDTLKDMNAFALFRAAKEVWDGELAAFFGSAGGADRAKS